MPTTANLRVVIAVLSRGQDASTYPVSRTNEMVLDSTTTAFATDVTTFATDLYSLYTSEASDSSIQVVELRCRFRIRNADDTDWIDVVTGKVLDTPTSDTDITNQLTVLVNDAIQQVGYN